MSGSTERVFLEADDEIRGQKFVCLSFLTPKKGVLRNKDLYFFSKFLEFYAMDYKIRATESFVMDELRGVQGALSDLILDIENAELPVVTTATDVSGSSSVSEDASAASKKFLDGLADKVSKVREHLARKTAEDLEAHVKTNLNDFKESSIVESYEKYMVVNRQKLEDEFHKLNEFQTTMLGLKVRGVYSTHEQAADRARKLHKADPYFHIFVAEVGEWLPWDPEADEVQDGEYANDELNKLMKSYKENAAKRDAFFEEEKREKMAAAAAAAAAAKAKPKAPVFGESEETTESASSLFGAGGSDGHGDLAIARRAAAAGAGSTISHA